ncbi:MAG: 3D domain-containing protein, partial [Actinomycetota bacterium]|nr:3D domain-containing protein [Actinomycetota bacterium]
GTVRSCYGPRLVQAHLRTETARAAAVLAGFLLVAAVPVALAADATGLRSQAAVVRRGSDSLEARANAATLELYAIQSQLGRAQAELERIGARRAHVAHDRAAARKQIAIVRDAKRVAENRLADLVRALYEQPDHKDPLAILLGAGSLEEALTGFDNLDRTAAENLRIVDQARSAKAKLRVLDTRLAARDAELSQLVTATTARTAQLTAAAGERKSFVAALHRQQDLNAARVAAIEARARSAEARTAAIPATRSATAAPATSAAPEVAAVETAASAPLAAPPAAGARTLTVSATGYALRGLTATGIQTAPGVVAVDPSVIPLGTRMTIPGYGEGVAADTGGAVQGNIIDLWFPSVEQALTWGRRTVTITIH